MEKTILEEVVLPLGFVRENVRTEGEAAASAPNVPTERLGLDDLGRLFQPQCFHDPVAVLVSVWFQEHLLGLG